MAVKHSKYRNTGLIFELLCQQMTADVLSNNDLKAISIIKKYFSPNKPLAKELKLYEYILKNKNVDKDKAQTILSSILEVSKRLNRETLKSQKHKLISEIKESYDIDKFFSIRVRDYKPLAALYCLLEMQYNVDSVDLEVFSENWTTLVEHVTRVVENKDSEYSRKFKSLDRDIQGLSYKFLLEKFNTKYSNLLPEQKSILKKIIESIDSYKELRELVSKEFSSIETKIVESISKVSDDIVKIKLKEISSQIPKLDEGVRVEDSHLVSILQHYQLINELENAER